MYGFYKWLHMVTYRLSSFLKLTALQTLPESDSAHDWYCQHLAPVVVQKVEEIGHRASRFIFNPFCEAEFRCKFILDKLPSNWYAQVTWDDGVPTLLGISFVVFVY